MGAKGAEHLSSPVQCSNIDYFIKSNGDWFALICILDFFSDHLKCKMFDWDVLDICRRDKNEWASAVWELSVVNLLQGYESTSQWIERMELSVLWFTFTFMSITGGSFGKTVSDGSVIWRTNPQRIVPIMGGCSRKILVKVSQKLLY